MWDLNFIDMTSVINICPSFSYRTGCFVVLNKTKTKLQRYNYVDASFILFQTTLLSILSIDCPDGSFQARPTPGKTSEECRRCTVCPKGWGEIVPCTHAHDRQCEPCLNGTFSLVDVGDSNLKVCEPCAKCQPLKRKELVTCSSTHDAKCGGCEDGKMTS